MGFEQSYAAWFFGRSSEKWSKCVSYNFFPGEQLRLFELGKSEYRRSPFVCVDKWCKRINYDPAIVRGNQLYLEAQLEHLGPSPSPKSRRGTPAPKGQLKLQLKLRQIGMSGVYFVQESGIRAIKIGVAKDVNARVRNMATSTPHLLAVLAVIDGDIVVEQALHRRFANARIRREWFRPVPELLAYIAEIKARAA